MPIDSQVYHHVDSKLLQASRKTGHTCRRQSGRVVPFYKRTQPKIVGHEYIPKMIVGSVR
jgi:hypothetical protein